MGAVVPLDEHFSNIQAFIPSLFDEDVRSLDKVVTSIQAGELQHLFADANSATLIQQSWLAAWQASQGDTADPTALNRCPATDKTVLGILADYIKRNNLALCTPRLTRTGSNKDGFAIYHNAGYESSAFLKGSAWNYDTVASFLSNFFYGAHFVIPSAAKDNGGTGFENFYDSITATFTVTPSHDPNTPATPDFGPWRVGVKSSHYVGSFLGINGVNTSGIDYLDIRDNVEPSYDPLICSMLNGKTADSTYKTFIQLEGWQEKTTSEGAWHHYDYDSSQKTLWNFSTYGACVNSEKRCAPLFLAGPHFSLALDAKTHMPLYVGAGSKQDWMQIDLMQI